MQSGIKYDYSVMSINKNNISNIKDIILKNKLSGINITNPYKIIITRQIDIKNNLLKQFDAANCIRKEDDGMLSGTNTDGPGFIKMLDKNNIKIENKDFVILGSGGSAIAVAYTLAQKKASSLSVMCRDYNKGVVIKSLIIRDFPAVDIYVNKLSKSDRKIIINCTPVVPIPDGMLGGISIKCIKTIIDINYNDYGKYPGIKSLGGIDMLIYQAIFSVNYWFRTTIDGDIDIIEIKKYINDA